MTNKERIEDLLIEFDELDMQPMLIVPDPVKRAEDWKHELTYAIRHLKVEIAREIIAEIAPHCAGKVCPNLDFTMGYLTAMNKVLAELAEIKQKYVEGE